MKVLICALLIGEETRFHSIIFFLTKDDFGTIITTKVWIEGYPPLGPYCKLTILSEDSLDFIIAFGEG